MKTQGIVLIFFGFLLMFGPWLFKLFGVFTILLGIWYLSLIKRKHLIETIDVSFDKKLLIKKVWNEDDWKYQVEKQSTFLFFLWVGGWGDGSGIHYKTPIFVSLKEAKEYAIKIKNNYLKK